MTVSENNLDYKLAKNFFINTKILDVIHLFYCFVFINEHHHNHYIYLSSNILSWPKSSFGFFHKLLWKNPPEIFLPIQCLGIAFVGVLEFAKPVKAALFWCIPNLQFLQASLFPLETSNLPFNSTLSEFSGECRLSFFSFWGGC